MNNQDLFERYLMSKEDNIQVQTPVSSSIEILEPNKPMLGKSGISEEEFNKMFEDILKQ